MWYQEEWFDIYYLCDWMKSGLMFTYYLCGWTKTSLIFIIDVVGRKVVCCLLFMWLGEKFALICNFVNSKGVDSRSNYIMYNNKCHVKLYTLELHIIQVAGRVVLGGGASIYYSHPLQQLMLSFTQGQTFACSLNPQTVTVSNIVKITLAKGWVYERTGWSFA